MRRIQDEWRHFDEELNIPYPWYTSTCLEWLTALNFEGKRVFEYGMGDSSFWYSSRGAVVSGVDNDPAWGIGGSYASNKSDYINSIYELKEHFDIVVIDGLYRDECTAHAINCLKRGGYIIIDNYKQKSADLEDWPLTDYYINDILIKIYKEPNHEDWKTAVIQL